MSTRTSIEWCDRSSNPLRAYHIETGKRGWFCVHASDGCRRCYAESRNRWIGNGLFYRAQDAHLVRFEMSLKELQSWQRLAPGTKVFPFDMTDLFQEGVPDELIAQAFAAMASAPQVTFQVLTKRALRAQVLLGSEHFRLLVSQWWKGNLHQRVENDVAPYQGAWPLPNVWLGVSVEDQANADARIPLLVETPAAVRFVSYEPALGPVYFDRWLIHKSECCDACVQNPNWCSCCDRYARTKAALDWIIVGGESGGHARPFEVAWARSTVLACHAAGVAVFVKQLGARPIVPACSQQHFDWGSAIGRVARFQPTDRMYPSSKPWRVVLKSKKGADPREWPKHLRVREFPRAKAAA